MRVGLFISWFLERFSKLFEAKPHSTQMAALRVTVAGWVTCPYYQRAHFALRGIAVLNSNLHVEVVEQ